ncbi:nucleotide sugar dehydrogenase [Xylaria intraflava]|nr:nucleotide sugar dehydrogenase [Xylaria intraflava]
MASTAPTTPDDQALFTPAARLDEGQTDSSDHLSPDFEPPGLAVRNICYIGAGYVGGPTAAVTAYQNPHIRVTVVDKDERRIRRWNSKHLPIYEPGLRDIVRTARDGILTFISRDSSDEAGKPDGNALDLSAPSDESRPPSSIDMLEVPAREPNLFFSVETGKCISEADLIFIAVNTPTKSSGMGAGCAMDMAAFEAATVEIALHARAGTIIVEKSTVPCRTAQLVQDIMAARRPGEHFEILSNPEFLAAGTAVQDLIHPDRILIGSRRTIFGYRAALALAKVYAGWVPRARILTTNVWSSELSKLVANAMLAQRISSINSISAICEKTGADVDEVAVSIGRDPRIGGKFLRAGIGFGGSCFKKDVMSLAYLAESLGLGEVSEYWRQVVKLNEYQRERFTQRVIRCLNNTLVGKKLTVLGYAFKANTSDVRESLSLDIIRAFLVEKPREIAVFDPYCNPSVIKREIGTLLRDQPVLSEDGGPIMVYSDVYEACMDSNAILITTDCDEFKNAKSPVPSFPALESNDCFVPRLPSQHELTEMDSPSLQTFLPFREPFGLGSGASSPFRRYRDEPSCAEDCPECALVETDGYQIVGDVEKSGARERVDWQRICYNMKKPKWLFDGKGVIDLKEMGALDIHVESVGRQG